MESLGVLGGLGLEGFCYSCIPTLFSSGLLTAWRVAERIFAEYSVSSSITHRRVIFVFIGLEGLLLFMYPNFIL